MPYGRLHIHTYFALLLNNQIEKIKWIIANKRRMIHVISNIRCKFPRLLIREIFLLKFQAGVYVVWRHLRSLSHHMNILQ